MGNGTSKFTWMTSFARRFMPGRRKRRCIEEEYGEVDCEFINTMLLTPKKRKLLTTSEYIYKTLFQQEEGSDVTIVMLGTEWKLHKVYLNQSPYFESMFSGAWRESEESVINVEIVDPNITQDSLKMVLGSLYQDEFSMEPDEVISVLATARLFQLQGLIDQCTEIMVETTNFRTAVRYYRFAETYGVPAAKTAAKRWLEVNLLGFAWRFAMVLKEIPPELMTELVSSPALVTVQTEFCIYMMLRAWLFVHIEPTMEGYQMEEYYENHKWIVPFLTTAKGSTYAQPFKALRMKYLLLHDRDVSILHSDNLIPPEWLHNAYKEQWMHLLKIDANLDRGTLKMSQKEFARECFRCGRCIDTPGNYVWRWTAFHFGLEIAVVLDMTSLRIRRTERLDPEHLDSTHDSRNIIIKVSVISLNEQRQTTRIQSSGMMGLALRKHDEVQLLSLRDTMYPLYVSVNMQVVTPFEIPGAKNPSIARGSWRTKQLSV